MGRWLQIGGAAAALLVAFGIATTPNFLTTSRGVIGACAVLLVLGGYILTGRLAAPVLARVDPVAMTWARRGGLAAALVYAAEVLLEYAVTPTDNTAWGLVEFGLVFLAYAAAGAAVAWRTGRWLSAVRSGSFAAMGATIVWYVTVLAVFYLFRDTARQAAVLRAEGDLDDFRRSGEASLQAFLMGDFLGAGFFHLTLSYVLGALFGALGGGLALASRALRPKPTP